MPIKDPDVEKVLEANRVKAVSVKIQLPLLAEEPAAPLHAAARRSRIHSRNEILGMELWTISGIASEGAGHFLNVVSGGRVGKAS